MVEVFKTNVQDRHQAAQLLGQIHKRFTHYRANFDLEDCDHILRVECSSGFINPCLLIELLQGFGFEAQVLLMSHPIVSCYGSNKIIYLLKRTTLLH